MTLRERVIHKLSFLIPRKLSSKEIAFTGVMAAVMAVAAFIPVTVVAGVGKVISAAVMLEPLIGVLLGPVLGTYSAAAGAFAGQILAPQGAIFGLLTFIPPTVGAAAAGLLAYKKWKAACGVMGLVLLLWYSTSIGRELYYYPYLPLIFLGLALVFRGHLGEWIHVKYSEIIGFRGAGITLMIGGLFLVSVAWVVIFGVLKEVYMLGITSCAMAVLFLLGFVVKENSIFKKFSALTFLVGGALLVWGLAHSGQLVITAILLFVSLFFLVLVFFGYTICRKAFVLSLVVFGISAGILMVNGLPAHTDDGFLPFLLQRISYALVIAGCVLFSTVYFGTSSLKKWSGITLFLAGFTGLIQQFLLLSVDSQIIRRELLRLNELPFSTSILGRETDIATGFQYYTQKVFPVYVDHSGWFLIFIAVAILGTSFLLNISLEKLSIAYFIISGFAVLADLMIGNFLAIQVLELKAGIFKAFLFIYPVERIFMALFATIFGVGVFLPLKKYGLNQLIRR